jgi:predicted permease
MPRISLLETVGREVRSAARTLLHSPVFTVTSLLILAICIGANTALFSVVDAVLLRPLPYPEPERLGEVIARYRTKGAVDDEDAQTGQTWFLLRDHARAFDTAVFSGISSGVNFAAAGRAEYVQQERVGAGFFRVLGVPPLLGREFSADEDRPGGAAVAVLSHPFWSRVFHSDPAALGRAVMLGGEPHVIVGVMPPGFTTPATGDLWTPLRPSTDGEGEGENYSVIARLRPGATWEQAASEVAVIGETALRERLSQGVSARLLLLPLQRGLTASVRAPLLVLWAAAIVVLLIGCVNIAGLLLARAAARTRELATRLALGAARLAVLRQLLAESLLLSLGGGLGGLLLAFWALRELRWMAQDSLHLWQTMTLDGRVLGAALGVSILTSLAFGLLPAFRMSRIDLRAVLGEGGRGATDGGYRWARRLLVVAEVALGVVLLVSAGLLLRSFAAMRALQPGFEAAHVMTAQVSLQDARYATRRQVDHLFTASLERLRAVPGVEAAAVGLGLPYERTSVWASSSSTDRRPEKGTRPPPTSLPISSPCSASPSSAAGFCGTATDRQRSRWPWSIKPLSGVIWRIGSRSAAVSRSPAWRGRSSASSAMSSSRAVGAATARSPRCRPSFSRRRKPRMRCCSSSTPGSRRVGW